MLTRYTVKATFKHPAWDERDGITYTVLASSKAEANRRARRMADDDGHQNVTFKASEASSDVSE